MTTREVGMQLGVSPDLLIAMIRRQKITPPPPRDRHRFYAWSPADVERAREALCTDLRRRPECVDLEDSPDD